MRKSKNLLISRKNKLEGIKYSDDVEDKHFSNEGKRSCFMFAPEDTWKIIWELIGMIFILYQGIVIPFRICFQIDAYGGEAVFELIQDFYFIIDIFISINTGVYINGVLCLNRIRIIINYFKFWFWLDISASFPYELLISPKTYFSIEPKLTTNIQNNANAPQILRLLKFMRFMRFLRLLRVIKLQKIMEKVKIIINYIV